MILGKYMYCLGFTSLIIHAKTGMISDREKVNQVPISIWFLINLQLISKVNLLYYSLEIQTKLGSRSLFTFNAMPAREQAQNTHDVQRET